MKLIGFSTFKSFLLYVPNCSATFGSIDFIDVSSSQALLPKLDLCLYPVVLPQQ